MTSLPVDYRNRPWRTKYLTDETPVLNRWFKFGTFPDGTVGVSDGTLDVLEYVPEDVADRVVAARNAFCDVLEKEFGYPNWPNID